MSRRPEALAAVASEITRQSGRRCEAAPERAVHGGSIGECHRWRTAREPLFVKLAPASSAALLRAEADGLRALERAMAVRVPRIVAVGETAELAFLALEWIDARESSAVAESLLGERLAAQHRVTAERFGWHCDNFIGSTPQRNDWLDDWTEFWRERRLRVQLGLAARNGLGAELQAAGERLLEALPRVLAGHRPVASLLHGDLWGGNWFADAAGEPVIFDPAAYFGDRETDLAMTELFGGFGRDFQAAYRAAWPLDAGYELRRDLYDAYHVLNHANLFGAGYVTQARRLMERIVTKVL